MGKNCIPEKQENEIITKKNKIVFSKSLLLKSLNYLILFILCLILKGRTEELVLILGDFGSIIPLLLQIFCVAGLTWCPIFSVIGIILLFLGSRYKEISKVYLIITNIVAVVSILLLLLL